jgi:hypothetical protein
MTPFPKKRWTIMLYMVGFKDSSFLRDALFEIKRIGSNRDVNVLAELDTGCDGIATKRYYLTRMEREEQIYQTIKAINSDSLITDLDEMKKLLNVSELDRTAVSLEEIKRLEVTVGSRKRTLRSVFDDVLDDSARRCLREILGEKTRSEIDASSLVIYILGCLLEIDNVSHIGNREGKPRKMMNSLGQTDAGAPQTLTDFIQWGITNYPSDRRMIIILGHGDGTSIAWDMMPQDITRSSELSVNKLSMALTIPVKGQRKQHEIFDIIGFNSCQMGTLEIYHHLKGLADFGVHSEGGSPKENWPYCRIIGGLQQHPDLASRKVVELIVQEFVDRYSDFEEKCREDIDIAACEIDKAPALVNDVDDLAKLLLTRLTANKTRNPNLHLIENLNRAREKCQSYDVGDFQFVDLSDFCKQLCNIPSGEEPDKELRSICDQIIKDVEAMAFLAAPFTLAPCSHGLSIYFPKSGSKVVPEYQNRLEIKSISWRKFLEKYISLLN